MTPAPASDAACALMIGGVLLKAALFPLHFWLPPAHAAAPAPVSAALSALVVKAAIYLILRLWLDLFAGIANVSVAMLLGLLGGIAVLWGSWQALCAERLKLLAAYSTVAQIGYLAMFLPLFHATLDEDARASLLAAWVLLALTHGLAKAGFFLAAGLVQKTTGHDRILELGGAAQSLPAATFALGLAGAALIGLPPSGTFFAKWLLIQTAIVSGQWWWVPVVMLGTLLAVGYVFRILARAFTREPTPAHFVTDARTELPALILAALSLLGVGLAARPITHLLGV
ncbi:proton-conducting transporter membrane subunit [Caldichromatium japonicum]|uniref:proton-conducting transporter transmembrane domain-containing protein n=1 Tax=Caldichromatium japonicum TaxID=2699430 RepID=UPI0031B60A7D